MSNSALSLRNLSYRYKNDWGGARRNSLNDITLDVVRGEAFGFLGHNGAGKTTTIKAILNFIHPTKGEIEIFGVSSRHDKARAVVGYVPEQPYFYEYVTVREGLTFFGHLAGVHGRELSIRVAEIVELVGLTEKIEAPLRSLSKGLTQRFALAQALIHSPQFLILDEPFSGLDPVARALFRDILLALKQEGITIFMCSHVLSDVERIRDRVSIMVDGSLKGVFDLHDAAFQSCERYELTLKDEIQEMPTTNPVRVLHQRGATVFVYASQEEGESALHYALHQGYVIKHYECVTKSLEEISLSLVSQKGVQ